MEYRIRVKKRTHQGSHNLEMVEREAELSLALDKLESLHWYWHGDYHRQKDGVLFDGHFLHDIGISQDCLHLG